MSREPGLASSLARACLLPVLLGAGAGVAVVVLVLRLSQGDILHREPAATSTLGQSPQERAIILLTDSDGEQVIGYWEWRSSPHTTACIPSNELLVEPQGMTLGEILSSALAAGGEAWAADTARNLVTGCRAEPAGEQGSVILVPAAGLVELVDALGGIKVGGSVMSGRQAWEYMNPQSAPARDIQSRQRAVWLALAEAARNSDAPACGLVRGHVRSVPPSEDACRQLELVLRQTPPDIRTP